MSANVFSARLYQNECSIATERSKVGWTAAAHEVAKETFPSLPPGASSSWARAARDEASRNDAETAKARRLALMRDSRRDGRLRFTSIDPSYRRSSANCIPADRTHAIKRRFVVPALTAARESYRPRGREPPPWCGPPQSRRYPRSPDTARRLPCEAPGPRSRRG